VNADSAMQIALDEAKSALEHEDVPIGAVLLDASGDVVARNHNRREELGDATAHAEMLVISQRSQQLGDWRLIGHTLVVTLEPCAMCAMAAVWARVDRIIYGAPDLKAGAAWSLFNIPQDERLNHRIELDQGVLEEQCRSLLETNSTKVCSRSSVGRSSRLSSRNADSPTPAGSSIPAVFFRRRAASHMPRSRLSPLRSRRP